MQEGQAEALVNQLSVVCCEHAEEIAGGSRLLKEVAAVAC